MVSAVCTVSRASSRLPPRRASEKRKSGLEYRSTSSVERALVALEHPGDQGEVLGVERHLFPHAHGRRRRRPKQAHLANLDAARIEILRHRVLVGESSPDGSAIVVSATKEPRRLWVVFAVACVVAAGWLLRAWPAMASGRLALRAGRLRRRGLLHRGGPVRAGGAAVPRLRAGASAGHAPVPGTGLAAGGCGGRGRRFFGGAVAGHATGRRQHRAVGARSPSSRGAGRRDRRRVELRRPSRDRASRAQHVSRATAQPLLSTAREHLAVASGRRRCAPLSRRRALPRARRQRQGLGVAVGARLSAVGRTEWTRRTFDRRAEAPAGARRCGGSPRVLRWPCSPSICPS